MPEQRIGLLAYSVVNPSDEIILDAPDHRSATAACLLLGNGKYALEPREGSDAPEVPIMFLGGMEEWLRETFGQTFEEFLADIKAHPTNTIQALESVRLANGERTSLNDIVGAATVWVARLREMGRGT